MKKIKFIALAFLALTLGSCMGDSYADPDLTEKVPAAPWGNNSLKEKNVISIADLKTQFATVIANSSYKLIEKDMMIKAVVTGNDVSGNIYNQVSVQDASGAIIIAVNGSGLSGYLPVGQEILINLKGLYIGSYKKLPQIGGVNTKISDGTLSMGKIERAVWNEHFKILNPGEADASTVEPEEFDKIKLNNSTKEEKAAFAAYMEANVGKLMTLKKVKFTSANGTNVWAPKDTNTSLELIDAETGKRISSSNLVVRNSGYSKFANEVVPQGVFDITGIFTRFGDTWQIVLRNTDDLKAAQTGGTLEKPYTVAQALEKINAGTAGDAKVYATGIIVKVKDVNTGTYGNGTFVISDDGKDTEGKTLEVFRCFNIDGAKWTEETKGILVPGKKVVVSGTLLDYNGTKEIKGGNLISIK
ncbi:DUF5689 domain-containing protein [Segatella sp.]|uniref:DUF5689 domain-containing protein n=1 Tax=Segatella sp. TaxID=2974253 RepID=UPI003078F62B